MPNNYIEIISLVNNTQQKPQMKVLSQRSYGNPLHQIFENITLNTPPRLANSNSLLVNWNKEIIFLEDVYAFGPLP
jgi:hypothetical protein